MRAALEALLLNRASAARDRWEKWQSGALTRETSTRMHQRKLRWEPALGGERPEDHEHFLQQVVTKHLLANGWRPHDAAGADGFKLPASNLLRLRGRGLLYPDIVLVDVSRRRRVLIVEVKKHAVPAPGRSGIDQLEDYGPAMKQLAPDWTIARWLVAKTIDPAVLSQARSLRIKCFLWRERPRGLVSPS